MLVMHLSVAQRRRGIQVDKQVAAGRANFSEGGVSFKHVVVAGLAVADDAALDLLYCTWRYGVNGIQQDFAVANGCSMWHELYRTRVRRR